MKTNERGYTKCNTKSNLKMKLHALFAAVIVFFLISPVYAQEKNQQERSLLMPERFHQEIKKLVEAEIKAPIEYF